MKFEPLPPLGAYQNTGETYFSASYLSPTESSALLTNLIEKLPWQSLSISLFGKSHPQPRLTCWLTTSPSLTYTYSKTTMTPFIVPDCLLPLLEKLQHDVGVRLNNVLCNYYRSGKDCMGMHADDEKELGPDPCIVSISLGAERKFRMVAKRQYGTEKKEWMLPNGSLFVMKGKCQTFWKHGVPKMLKVNEPRVNLTFRFIENVTPVPKMIKRKREDECEKESK